MKEKYRFSKSDFSRVSLGLSWDIMVRQYELDALFVKYGENHFGQALELGCGSGVHSRHLSRFCSKLVATEVDASRLEPFPSNKIEFAVVDAEDLSPFEETRFDLVFASNMLEHVYDQGACLSEVFRVLKTDGLAVFTLPTRTWKVFNSLLYYLHLPGTLMLKVWRKWGWRRPEGDSSRGVANTSGRNVRPNGERVRPWRLMVPPVHGSASNNLEEFRSWKLRKWESLFESNGFVVERRLFLPFYHGWDERCWILLKAGNALGLTSSVGFVLRKRNAG